MTQKLILVLNCGSSSLKGAAIDNDSGEVLLSCLAEKLNLPDAFVTFKANGEKHKVDLSAKPNHTGAVEALMEELKAHGLDSKIGAIGHRIVSGGELYSESILVDDEVIAGIEKCIPLAPLHNPAHLLGLRAAQSIFKGLPNVVVFDTAFHQSMPKHAYTYAIPQELYRKYGLRRYGAHGTSYRFVADETARFLGKNKEDLRMVIAHLGNGASISAVAGGQCQDTSMGLTPLEEEAAKGHEGAILAMEVFVYRLAKYVGSMAVAAGGLDALVFTGGIGENSELIRSKVLGYLGFLGLTEDHEANLKARFGNAGVITTTDSKAVAVVIPTNEELMIAHDTARLSGL